MVTLLSWLEWGMLEFNSLSTILFVFKPGYLPIGSSHSHSGWNFPPQLDFSGNAALDSLEVCLLSEHSQVNKNNHNTRIYMAKYLYVSSNIVSLSPLLLLLQVDFHSWILIW